MHGMTRRTRGTPLGSRGGYNLPLILVPVYANILFGCFLSLSWASNIVRSGHYLSEVREPMYQTNMYEGLLAETVVVRGANGDLINAYFARPLVLGPIQGWS